MKNRLDTVYFLLEVAKGCSLFGSGFALAIGEYATAFILFIVTTLIADSTDKVLRAGD